MATRVTEYSSLDTDLWGYSEQSEMNVRLTREDRAVSVSKCEGPLLHTYCSM